MGATLFVFLFCLFFFVFFGGGGCVFFVFVCLFFFCFFYLVVLFLAGTCILDIDKHIYSNYVVYTHNTQPMPIII